ncbi:MAG: hypothetical protein ABJD11_14050 [Gemmatimonadota bacterium]
MRLFRLTVVAGAFGLAACHDSSVPTQPSDQSGVSPSTLSIGSDAIHIMPLDRGSQGPSALAGPILYHGGPILVRTKVASIYWATSRIYNGGPTPGTKGVGTADGSLVGYFLRNVGGSPYFNINTTYTDKVAGGHRVTNSVTYTQFWADNTSVPPSTGSTVSNATIRTEIIKGLNQGKLTYDPATVYLVFTRGNTNLGGGFGSQYCAYHGTFAWNGKTIVYAAMPFDHQYVNGCTSRLKSPNNDQAADDEMSAMVHEIEESTTDFQLNAWFDAAGNENADKCAFNFGTTYTTTNGGKANVKLGTKDFLIQQNWVAPNTGCRQHFP